MVIKPKVRGFICTNAHPVGCAHNVERQINYVKAQQLSADNAPKNVLVIGCSTGYGLASRITAAIGYGANTLGVCFEKAPTERKTGSAGWYNTAAFHRAADSAGVKAKTLNGDAFSNEMKADVIAALKEFGPVDQVIYSLASPRRTDPASGETYRSTLKPVGQAYTTKTYDTDKDLVHDVTLEPASEQEIADTIKVMGGEDWQLWLRALHDAGCLSENCVTTAYTYIGKALTWPIYGSATIGKAKDDLDRAAAEINRDFSDINVTAYVSSLKALVTQASSAIPVMPLYISLIYKVMKEEGTHEGCIEQIVGLYNECLLNPNAQTDEAERYRMDGKETNDATQAKIQALWEQVKQDNFHDLSDYAGYHRDFLNLFGFGFDAVDYEVDVDPLVEW